MDLGLTDDQRAILEAIDALARPYENPVLHETGFAMPSAELDAELAEGGFLDVAFDPDLGEVSAALVVERLARLAYAVEAGASALVRPLLGDNTPRPLCLIEAGKKRPLVRFLQPGATVLVVGDDCVSSFVADESHIEAVTESLFAYPVTTLVNTDGATPLDVSVDDILTRWRVALAAEAAGLLAASLASAQLYTTERKQFGREIATFQAIRHRMAEAQVRTNGAYWLTMKAAGTLDAGDAAMAASFAQDTIRQVVYDFHQFLGAMGMTLEHPLHLWTYRLKLLSGELGGRSANALAAADAIWG